MSFSSTKASGLVLWSSARWGDGRFLVKVVCSGGWGKLQAAIPIASEGSSSAVPLYKEMMGSLLLFPCFYIPLYSGALVAVCFALFPVQLEIPFGAWCSGFVLWGGNSRDVRVPQTPCAGSQGCLWCAEHAGVCSRGSNGIIILNWTGFVGIVEAICDLERANCLTVSVFLP